MSCWSIPQRAVKEGRRVGGSVRLLDWSELN